MREIYAFLGGFGHFWTLWAVHGRTLDAMRVSMDGGLARSSHGSRGTKVSKYPNYGRLKSMVLALSLESA